MLKIAPPRLDAPVHGVSRQIQVENDIDEHLEELLFLGYTVVEKAASPEVVAAARDKLEALEAAQIAEAENLNTRMEDHRGIVRCPLVQDNVFLRLATLPAPMEIARRCLGENFVLLLQSGILNRPGKIKTNLFHRDLNHQHFVADAVLSINFLVALDDFTEENGATRVLPATHLSAPFPSTSFAKRHERAVCAPAGAAIIMNSMLYHRTGDNRTKSFVRRGVNHVVGSPMLAPFFDMPKMLTQNGLDFSGDDFLAKYLGYRWRPAESVLEWHKKRQT